MIDQVASWFRSRTKRERMLLQAMALLVAIVVPLWLYSAASSYRRAAQAELDAAYDIETRVRRIVAASAGGSGPVESDLRTVATSIAQTFSLSVKSAEVFAPDQMRIAFDAADPNLINRWMEAVMRRGVLVTKTSIVREGETALVAAEFEIAASP